MSDKRFELHFVRTVNEVFDPWELSNFINDFGNEYYKFDLLRNIALELEKGELPENILILNNSIKRKYINYEYIDLKNSSMFNSFQSIGYPISLYPNKEILKMSLVIRLYKRLNKILNKNISSNILTSEYQKLHNGSLSSTLNNLYEAALEKLPKNASITIKNNIINIKNEIEKEYTNYLSHEEEINKLIQQLKNNEAIDTTNLLDQYFNYFFELFSKTSKPLVGIYLEEEKKIKIICSKHLRKRKETLPELDFKRFGHNSPPFFDILTGAAQIGKTIYDSKKEQELRDEQIKTEKLNQIYVNTKVATEIVKKETILVRKQILEEQLIQLKEKRSSESNNINTIEDEIAEIRNTHVKLNVMELYNNQTLNMNLLLKRNKLNLKDINSKIDKKA
ncbi:hypothetical protein KD050_04970 [Psychrobacillus sp. INOP01]|uniref:hypothetical protein n=1 Tax=Psychrobacillus sp. INOP01 TaxID=2829187 RepID=UPI001BA7C29F|nr:hypothetical protein [Psychrobacillus sp. INOP01]QUG42629.1 hypothetical protein KD050_04970 [Psychrobacillus sp. INOP01]